MIFYHGKLAQLITNLQIKMKIDKYWWGGIVGFICGFPVVHLSFLD